MKAKTIEELREEFDFPLKVLKLKEAPFWMLYSEFLEQKLLQPEPQMGEEITIFPEKEYHFQFRDLETLKGISDYKVSGKRFMQYLHNAELSLNNK
jgi:hypothetical protein